MSTDKAMASGTVTVSIPGFEPTAFLRMPVLNEWIIGADGKPRQCQRSHRKTVAVVLVPVEEPKTVELPYQDLPVNNGVAMLSPNGGGTSLCNAFFLFKTRLIGFVYSDGSVSGEPYRFRSAVDRVEIPVFVRIKKDAAK